MKYLAVAAICLVLTSCAARMAVAPIEVSNQARYLANVDKCTLAAASYKPEVSVSSVLFGAITKGLDVVSYALLYPWMPVLGAVSGASQAATNGFDITGRVRANVFRHCVADATSRDQSAIIANPDDN